MSFASEMYSGGLQQAGQGANLASSAFNDLAQNSSRLAAQELERRRMIEQQRLAYKQLEFQKEQAKQAEDDKWLTMGIGTAAGVGGGAALGALASGVAPAAEAAGEGAANFGMTAVPEASAAATDAAAAAPAAASASPSLAAPVLGGSAGMMAGNTPSFDAARDIPKQEFAGPTYRPTSNFNAASDLPPREFAGPSYTDTMNTAPSYIPSSRATPAIENYPSSDSMTSPPPTPTPSLFKNANANPGDYGGAADNYGRSYGRPDTLEGYGSTGANAPTETAPRLSSIQLPAYRPFAGGNPVLGGIAGGLLGGAGHLSGQNFLGPAMAMPGEEYGRALHGVQFGINAANTGAEIGLRQAETAKAIKSLDTTEEDALKRAQAYEHTQRGDLYGAHETGGGFRETPMEKARRILSDTNSSPEDIDWAKRTTGEIAKTKPTPFLTEEQRAKMEAETNRANAGAFKATQQGIAATQPTARPMTPKDQAQIGLINARIAKLQSGGPQNADAVAESIIGAINGAQNSDGMYAALLPQIRAIGKVDPTRATQILTALDQAGKLPKHMSVADALSRAINGG